MHTEVLNRDQLTYLRIGTKFKTPCVVLDRGKRALPQIHSTRNFIVGLKSGNISSDN